MIPKWAYRLMIRDRLNSGMAHDEHGREIVEELPPVDSRLAFPGFGDYREKRDEKPSCDSSAEY